jgi:hypothetical protein
MTPRRIRNLTEAARCLCRPCAAGMRGDAGQVNAASAVLDHDQRVDALQEDGVNVHEIGRQDPAGLPGEELFPGRTGASGCRIDPGFVEDLPYRGGRNMVAEPGELALYAPVSTPDYQPRCGSRVSGSRLPWAVVRGDPGWCSPTCARPAAGARPAGSDFILRSATGLRGRSWRVPGYAGSGLTLQWSAGTLEGPASRNKMAKGKSTASTITETAPKPLQLGHRERAIDFRGRHSGGMNYQLRRGVGHGRQSHVHATAGGPGDEDDLTLAPADGG